ncbi:30S ribosomal protein S21 [Aeoliella straminimaris]|uniref:30S ribosomal protein S21 n=1 Tax=Aeoliella straminimaris TaxID=2954799 RepID=UPI003CC6D48B
MPGRVEVREGESIQSAVRRLSLVVHRASRRPWYKSRPGCYLKPSERRRNKEALRKRNARRAEHRQPGGPVTVYLSLRQQLATRDVFELRKPNKHPSPRISLEIDRVIEP